MKILAFDQATIKTGVAWFEDTTLKGFELIDFHKIKDTKQRQQLMILKMYEKIRECEPDVIVFEDVAMQRSAGAVILLAQIQGALLGYCLEHDIVGIIYKPALWRKMLNFKQGSKVKREALKQQAVDYAKKYYDVDAGEDIADAICIGHAFAMSYDKTLEQENRGVLDEFINK